MLRINKLAEQLNLIKDTIEDDLVGEIDLLAGELYYISLQLEKFRDENYGDIEAVLEDTEYEELSDIAYKITSVANELENLTD